MVPRSLSFNPASLLRNVIDITGDSRGADATSSVGRRWKSASNWVTHALMLCSQSLRLGGIFATSGLRSDQWITTWMPSLLASRAAHVVFGCQGGVVNDISQAGTGYTDTLTGVSVTTTNVAAVTAANKQAAIKQLVRQGKTIIIQAEIGSNSFSAAMIVALFEHNALMRKFAQSYPNCEWLDLRAVLWNPLASTTAISLLNSADGTHVNNLGGYVGAKEAIVRLPNLFKKPQRAGQSILENNGATPRALCPNPLFNTLTGGTTSGGFTLTGNVPGSCQLITTLTTTGITITNSADPEGLGNRIRLAITTVAAETVRFRIGNAISNSLWNLTDLIEGGCRIAVAAASSHLRAYWDSIINTTGTAGETADNYDGYATVDGPTEAYAYDFHSEPNAILGATKGFITPTLYAVFSAAGSATIDIFQPFYDRVQ